MPLNLKANIPPVPKYLGTDIYNLRTLLESSDETEKNALWDFIKVKHQAIYKDCDEGMCLPTGKLFVPPTPIEVFQKPPVLLRRQMFFKSLHRGDVLYLRVVNEGDDSYKLLSLAKHQGCWKVDDLSIVMYLPKYHLELRLLDAPIEINCIIRAAFCSCWLKERKLYVTLDNSIVKAEFKALPLGMVPKTDLPHYVGNKYLGISYTDYLFRTAEFNIPSWPHQFSFFGTDAMLQYSFLNLGRKKYSDLEGPSHLKMKQAALLSHSHYQQALHCIKLQVPNVAVVHLDNALKASAENVEALVLRGKLHYSLGDLKQAFMDTEAAVRLDYNHTPARKQMSRCLIDAAKTHIEQGNDNKAKQSLVLAQQLDSSNKEAYLSIKDIRDKLNNNLDSQNNCAEQIEYVKPVLIPTYVQSKKKKSKKHHRKRSRHHHKRSLKTPAYPLFLPWRRSPIPPPPAYPWDSSLARQELMAPNSQKNAFSSSNRLMSASFPGLVALPPPPPHLVSPPKRISTLPSLKNRQPHKSHPSYIQNPSIPMHSTKKLSVSREIRSSHYFRKQSPPRAPRSLSPTQIQSRSSPKGLCRSTTPPDHKLVPQNLNRSRKPFPGSKLPQRSFHKSRTPPRSVHIRSPPHGHRSKSPTLQKSQSLYKSVRSRSPTYFHKRSPSPDLHRGRSPNYFHKRPSSPDHHRNKSPSSYLRRHRLPSPNPHISRSPSPEIRKSKPLSSVFSRSRSFSPELHRKESQYQGLCKSRSPIRNLRRIKSPPRSFRRSRSRSPPRSLRKSTSRSPPRSLRRSRSRSPPRSLRRSRSRSPPRRLRRSTSRSPPRSLRRSTSRSPPRSLRRSRSLSPPRYRNRSRSPPQDVHFRFPQSNFREDGSLPHNLQRTPLHSSERLQAHYFSDSSIIPERSITLATSESSPTRKRKELIKSILESKSGKLKNQSIAQIAQGPYEKSPTSKQSHFDTLSITTYSRSPVYNMPERSPNRSVEIHSEQSIPTVPFRRINRMPSSYKNIPEF